MGWCLALCLSRELRKYIGSSMGAVRKFIGSSMGAVRKFIGSSLGGYKNLSAWRADFRPKISFLVLRGILFGKIWKSSRVGSKIYWVEYGPCMGVRKFIGSTMAGTHYVVQYEICFYIRNSPFQLRGWILLHAPKKIKLKSMNLYKLWCIFHIRILSGVGWDPAPNLTLQIKIHSHPVLCGWFLHLPWALSQQIHCRYFL